MTRHGEVFFLYIVLNILLGLDTIQGELLEFLSSIGVIYQANSKSFRVLYGQAMCAIVIGR